MYARPRRRQDILDRKQICLPLRRETLYVLKIADIQTSLKGLWGGGGVGGEEKKKSNSKGQLESTNAAFPRNVSFHVNPLDSFTRISSILGRQSHGLQIQDDHFVSSFSMA